MYRIKVLTMHYDRIKVLTEYALYVVYKITYNMYTIYRIKVLIIHYISYKSTYWVYTICCIKITYNMYNIYRIEGIYNT